VYISLHNCSNYTHYVNRYVNAPSLSSAPLSLPPSLSLQAPARPLADASFSLRAFLSASRSWITAIWSKRARARARDKALPLCFFCISGRHLFLPDISEMLHDRACFNACLYLHNIPPDPYRRSDRRSRPRLRRKSRPDPPIPRGYYEAANTALRANDRRARLNPKNDLYSLSIIRYRRRVDRNNDRTGRKFSLRRRWSRENASPLVVPLRSLASAFDLRRLIGARSRFPPPRRDLH